MERKIHTIFDVILKLIMVTYSNDFLKLTGENRCIKKILKTEIVTKKGRKLYLDFLCQLEDNQLLNIEFQFTGPDGADLERFFDYNIFTQVEYDELCETQLISFKTIASGQKSRRIGKTKSIHPRIFYLGDIDFLKKINTIENKVENNIKLTNIDEIMLMLMCLLPKYKNKQEILEKICKIHKKQKLFDKSKIDVFDAVIGLEIKNFVEINEQKRLLGELNMTPESKEMIKQAIQEAVKKNIQLEEQQIFNKGKIEGKKEGKKEGKIEGKIEGKKEQSIKIAKKLKKYHTPEEIQKITGLTLTTILKL